MTSDQLPNSLRRVILFAGFALPITAISNPPMDVMGLVLLAFLALASIWRKRIREWPREWKLWQAMILFYLAVLWFDVPRGDVDIGHAIALTIIWVAAACVPAAITNAKADENMWWAGI